MFILGREKSPHKCVIINLITGNSMAKCVTADNVLYPSVSLKLKYELSYSFIQKYAFLYIVIKLMGFCKERNDYGCEVEVTSNFR